MKKYVIALCCIVCVVVIAFAITTNANNDQHIYNGEGGESALTGDERIEEVPVNHTPPYAMASSEGFLENGIRYVFNSVDFNLNELRERGMITREEAIDSIIIARTPAEVAEMAQHYLELFICSRDISPEQAELVTIFVRYCSATDHWLVKGAAIVPDPGTIPMLAISRLDGSAVLIRYMGGRSIYDSEDLARKREIWLARIAAQD